MNSAHAIDRKLNISYWLLKITYGLLFIIAGADKFFNFVTAWEKYVSEDLVKILPIDLKTFILLVGIFEVVLGLIILLTKWTKVGAYVAALWLILIALNLLVMGIYHDIAVRDLIMAVGAIVLGIISNARGYK